MANGEPKPQGGQKVSIIHAVNTPLGFFTLGILAIEAILGSLTIKAQGIQLTLLICGMLVSFGGLVGIVFMLSLDPKRLNLLLGKSEAPRFGGDLLDLDLSSNDIRLLYRVVHSHTIQDLTELETVLQNPKSPLPERLLKLEKLSLIKRAGYETRYVLQPTDQARQLVAIIDKFAVPLYGQRAPI